MVFGGSRSLNQGYPFRLCWHSVPVWSLDRVPKFVSAKIAGCKHPVKRKTNDLSKLKYYKSKVKKNTRARQEAVNAISHIKLMFLFYNITRQIRQNAIHRNPGQLLLPLLSNICFQVVFSYSIQPNVVDDCSCTKMPWLFYLFQFENKVIAGNKNVLKRFTMFMMACH